MASPIANSSCAILAILLLLGSLFFTPSSAITKTDVTTVCSQTKNPSLCSTYLNSIPGLPAKTFKDLALTTADKVLSDIIDTDDLIFFKLDQQKRVPREEEVLTHCYHYYNQMTEQLLTSKAMLFRGISIHIIIVAETIVGLAAQCQKEVQGTTLPLTDNNLRIGGYSSVLQILSEYV